jgi:signal peptidase I
MFGKSVRWVATVALAAVVVVMVGVLLVPRAFGLTPYVITSGSMRPTFEPGAVVLTRDVPQSHLRVGDIITYRTSSSVTTHRVTHRVVVEDAAGQAVLLKTQGDANNARDTEPVDSRNVLGKVRFAVPVVGYVVQAMRTPAGIVVLVILLALACSGGGRARRDSVLELAEVRS